MKNTLVQESKPTKNYQKVLISYPNKMQKTIILFVFLVIVGLALAQETGPSDLDGAESAQFGYGFGRRFGYGGFGGYGGYGGYGGFGRGFGWGGYGRRFGGYGGYGGFYG